MTSWAIRDKKTGLFFNGERKDFVEVPINKVYRTEGHAKAALTQAQSSVKWSRKPLDYSGLVVVRLRVEVDDG